MEMPQKSTQNSQYQERMDELVMRLRAYGCRLTPQRMAILNVLIRNDDHLTADQVYARVHADYPMTSLATVYKTINLLIEMGELLEIANGHDSSRYDGSRPYPHPHLICIKCNTIFDLELSELEGLAQRVAQVTGFQITNHRLDFFGLCPKCQMA